MIDYFEIDIGTNNSTQQQIQSMNSLRSSDGLVAVGLRRGSQLRHERNGGSDALPFSPSGALADLINTKQQETILSNPSRGENRKVETI